MFFPRSTLTLRRFGALALLSCRVRDKLCKVIQIRPSYKWAYSYTIIIEMGIFIYDYHRNGHIHIRLSYKWAYSYTIIVEMGIFIYDYHRNGHIHIRPSYKWAYSNTTIIQMGIFKYDHHTNGHIHIRSSYKWAYSYTIIVEMGIFIYDYHRNTSSIGGIATSGSNSLKKVIPKRSSPISVSMSAPSTSGSISAVGTILSQSLQNKLIY